MMEVSWYVEEGDVVEMCLEVMIPTASPKVVTGIGVLSGAHVKSYLTPYVGCSDMPFCRQ